MEKPGIVVWNMSVPRRLRQEDHKQGCPAGLHNETSSQKQTRTQARQEAGVVLLCKRKPVVGFCLISHWNLRNHVLTSFSSHQ